MGLLLFFVLTLILVLTLYSAFEKRPDNAFNDEGEVFDFSVNHSQCFDTHSHTKPRPRRLIYVTYCSR